MTTDHKQRARELLLRDLRGAEAAAERVGLMGPASLHRRAADFIEAALAQSAQQAVAVPDGFVLMPREPTLEMANAGWREVAAHGVDVEDIETPAIWAAMIAAAPPAPSGGWRSMDSAPRDGTLVVLRWKTNKPYLGFWYTNGRVGSWFDTNDAIRDATEWYPLPPAPVKQEGVG